MKVVCACAVILAMALTACGGDDAKGGGDAKAAVEAKAPPQAPAQTELKTPAQKLSYVLGTEIGKSLKTIDMEIDSTVFLRGMQDSMKGGTPLITPEQAEAVKMEVATMMQEEQQRKTKTLAEKNQKEGEAYIAANAKKDGVKTTGSGLQYAVVKEGTGAKPKATDQVSVHYVGTLIDGTEFDSSRRRNQPAVFPVDGVIPGWTEGLQLMSVGSTYRFVIPAKLAYGERGAGRAIGPNATLLFEVELLGIEKPEGSVSLPTGKE
jgi:FKBP-type peptidyl-prolyl cis-trans isomerase